MFRALILAALLGLATLAAAAQSGGSPQVHLETSMGTIVLALDAERAPATVENFLRYVHEGFYDGTLFHRVIGDFMIQGGGFTQSYRKKETHAPIRNESDNGLGNARGTVAMARTPDPHSATSQFFINVTDNPFLDYGAQGQGSWGYAVFGRVVEGMAVVDRIRQVPTGRGGPFPRDVPREPVVIERAHAGAPD